MTTHNLRGNNAAVRLRLQTHGKSRETGEDGVSEQNARAVMAAHSERDRRSGDSTSEHHFQLHGPATHLGLLTR